MSAQTIYLIKNMTTCNFTSYFCYQMEEFEKDEVFNFVHFDLVPFTMHFPTHYNVDIYRENFNHFWNREEQKCILKKIYSTKHKVSKTDQIPPHCPKRIMVLFQKGTNKILDVVYDEYSISLVTSKEYEHFSPDEYDSKFFSHISAYVDPAKSIILV